MIRRILRLAGAILALAGVIAVLAIAAFVAGFAVTVVTELGWSPTLTGGFLITIGALGGFAVAGLLLGRRSHPPTPRPIPPETTGMTMPAPWTENVRELESTRAERARAGREGLVR